MLSIYIGPMFSGKTSTLINMFNENKSNNKIIIDYNITNNEYNSNEILESHNKIKVSCIKCRDFETFELNNNIINIDTIYINEAQFFPDLFEFVSKMLNFNKNIYIYGLDGDYKRNKIGYILDLIPLCDEIFKLKGKCYICKNKSLFSKRLTDSNEQYVPDEKQYIPLCRSCFDETY